MSDSGTSPSPPEGAGGGAGAVLGGSGATAGGATAGATAANPPHHFKVGLSFVKAYYKTLTEQPEMLVNFYKAGTSYLSHGEGSTAADPKPLEDYDLSVKERWGCRSEHEKMRFDFEYGAIDTQPVAEGVLLVVTAQVFYEPDSSSKETNGENSKEAEDKEEESSNKAAAVVVESKSFVQTFFLVREGRNFACFNDVLRFLQFPSPSPNSKSVSTPTATASTNTVSSFTSDVGVSTDPSMIELPVEHAPPILTEELEVPTEAVPPLMDEAPGGGVEEMKEEAPEEEEGEPVLVMKTVAPVYEAPVKDGKARKNRMGSKSHPQQQQNKQQQPSSKPSRGSWASLVASGSAPNTPSRKTVQGDSSQDAETTKPPTVSSSKQDKVEPDNDTSEMTAAIPPEEPVSTTTSSTTNTTTNNNKNTTNNNTANNNNNTINNNNVNHKSNIKGQAFQQQQRPKRDPDNTLVIKNLSDNIKEQDIIHMFQPFAIQTNSNIVSTNLNLHRQLAFVDYDQVAPVLAALQKHEESPFQWNGKILEVDQKTQEVRARRHGNGFRNSTGGGGGGGGGNREQYRRGGGGTGGGGGRRGSRGTGRGGR